MGLVRSQLNPNSKRILLCLSVISAELGIEMGMLELKNMYNIKKDEVDKGRVYVLTRSSSHLELKLLKSISG